MKRSLLAVALFAAFAAHASVTNAVLIVDEYGNVTPTNALVTQAQIAAVTASNQLVLAQMEAAEAGYNAAIALLQQVARSMATTPIAFYGVELVGFEAAVVFGDDARIQICGFEPTSDVESKTVGGETLECKRHELRFAFTDSLQGVQPLVAYSTTLDAARAEWDDLNPALVSTPTLQSGSWTDGSGNTFANVYLMDVWLPTRQQGFCFVRVPNDAVSGDGDVMEFPGAKDGFNGEMQIGTNAVEFVNGGAYPAAGGGE